ncbi:MAG: YCF48-related protein [Pseudomonadota bacterium]
MRHLRLASAFTAVLLVTAAAPAADTLKAYPAEIMPKAVSTTLLDVTWTGQRYVTVGQRGHVLLSTDGKSWKQAQTPVRQMLNRVRFLDENLGWAVGHDGVIIHTADGGNSWSLQRFDPESQQPLNDVLFLDAQRGFAAGAPARFLQTRDGGKTWTPVEADFLALGLHLNTLLKLKDGSVFVGGEKGLLARSTDSGESWQMVKSPVGGSILGALAYGDAGVLMYGIRGRVCRTDSFKSVPTDDPKTYDEFADHNVNDPAALQKINWMRYDNTEIESLFGGALSADGKLVFVGVNGVMVEGTLAGTTLTRVATPSDTPLTAIAIRDDGYLVTGRAGIQHLPLNK